MKPQKKLTLAAVMSALGVVVMYVGALFQVLDLTSVALAALLVILARIELGHPYDWLVYGVTGALTFILMVGVNPLIPVLYLLYVGMYPILKAYIEQLPKALILTVKTVYFAFICLLLVGLLALGARLLGVPLFEGEAAGYTVYLLIVIYIVAVAVSFVFDMLLTQLIVLYVRRVRPKIERIFR